MYFKRTKFLHFAENAIFVNLKRQPCVTFYNSPTSARHTTAGRSSPTPRPCLQQSLGTLLRRPVETVGAGRTDTGVHASFYVVHFDTEAPIADPEDFCYHLNALLPYDIAVQRLRRVRNDAHARFDALEREYKYYISPRKNPFNRDTAYQLAWPLDLCRMNEAAALLPGEQDFTSFCKLHSDNKTNLCRIARAGWQRQDDGLLVFTIAADRFLRNMVRAVVGTLLDVGRGKLTAEDFRSVIAGRDRSLASSSAPPQGLFLSRVTYPETIYISDDTN